MRNYFYFYFSSRQPAKLIKLNKKFSPRRFESGIRIRSWYKNLFSIFYFPGGEPAEPTEVV